MARAEASLDEASRDRARAEARAAEAARQLEAAVNQAALDAAMARKLALRIRDPSTQITQVAARGGFIRADLQKLKGEITALRSLPRPKATSILTKSPVARPASSDEFHFELRRGRISFIDLERLLELAKSDAQVRIRMSDRSGLITSQVGPVRSFSLAYVLGRANAGIDELIERQSIRFDLKGWEIVPESEQRGETYEATRNPISEYTRAVNRLTPGRSVVTFWRAKVCEQKLSSADSSRACAFQFGLSGEKSPCLSRSRIASRSMALQSNWNFGPRFFGAGLPAKSASQRRSDLL